MLTEKQIEDNLPVLAMQLVSKNLYATIDGSNIYVVSEHRHKEELKKFAGMMVVKNKESFQELISNELRKLVLITKEANISLDEVQSLLKNKFVDFDIFIEQ